ncbi:HAD-IIB family hydrolase [Thiosulfativibrio zosterae]|uniref:Sucrose phosphatase-like domain-containing protein n=1 Tax=Thiosulfativibrio zosterae TaxID=2675053 RepID=A0A6F8PQT9_9GAMM|nr:HAD-IIB family hydrolase [Thiosulfativibrio zosterae]BBP44479.1 hypothetical protein THMIRHAT_22250 [Thiosulfativibrio zosterae]
MSKLLLCTDMDRTLIPNGASPEAPGARKMFSEICARPEIQLAYVTGRHLGLVLEAIEEYQLPTPDFAITDVGTKIYQFEPNFNQAWSVLEAWEAHIAKDWLNLSRQDLLALLSPLIAVTPNMVLQEDDKQNTHKLSFYCPMDLNPAPLIDQAEALLAQAGIQASLIWSLDEPNHIGLLDVLPRHATKLHAIEFLQARLNLAQNQVVFAGDSGNDLPVLISAIPAILVANASDELKQQALALSAQQHHQAALYLAQNFEQDASGNYAAGILQGLAFYHPQYQAILAKMVQQISESA